MIAPLLRGVGQAPPLFFIVSVACVAASLVSAPDTNGIFGAILAVLMLAIAAVDAQKFIIPDPLVFAALLLGLLRAGIAGDAAEFGLALLRAALCCAAFVMLMSAYQALRHRRGMGLGDAKLAAVAGAWLDWMTIAAAIELAAVSAIVAYALRSFLRNRRMRADAVLPFGLFFAPAIWLGWLVETIFF